MDNRLIRKAYKMIHKNKKLIYQSIKSRKTRPSILFIVGCQRSGTSMLLNVLDRDLNTRCFGEFSSLTSNDIRSGIRLNSLDLVKKEFSQVTAPLIVAKPLVESQNICELLDYFENSTAVWIFRNYRDVALSNVRKFGPNNALDDLRPIVNGDPTNWRSEKVSRYVQDKISEHFFPEMNPYDAAVLFWFARNHIFFDLELDRNPRIAIFSYDALVLEPQRYLRSIYRQVRQAYPKIDMTTEIHAHSKNRGKDISLSPEVEQLAQELEDKLEVAHRTTFLPYL